MRVIKIFFSLLLLLSLGDLQATIVYSDGIGNWESAGSWTTGVPLCGDTVIILPGDTITVTTQIDIDEISTPACSSAMYVEIRGNLNFQTGKKIAFPCGSGIFVASGGLLSGGTGGGSANIIEVCQTVIWKSGDGDITGAQWVGSGLPITLKSFKASVQSDVIQIEWKTLSEINNDFFTIEKSKDLKNIEELLVVEGAGNSQEEISYVEYDERPLSGVNYYRLKQTDFDGRYTFSDWTSVNLSDNSENGIKVLSSSAKNQFSVQFSGIKPGNYSINLITTEGKVLLDQNLYLDQHIQTRNFSIPDFSSGIVVLVIKNSDLIFSEKLLVN